MSTTYEYHVVVVVPITVDGDGDMTVAPPYIAGDNPFTGEDIWDPEGGDWLEEDPLYDEPTLLQGGRDLADRVVGRLLESPTGSASAVRCCRAAGTWPTGWSVDCWSAGGGRCRCQSCRKEGR